MKTTEHSNTISTTAKETSTNHSAKQTAAEIKADNFNWMTEHSRDRKSVV